MSPVFDVSSESRRPEGLDAAKAAIDDGKLVVLPTDTVYGIGADAFRPDAVASLLDAKGRGREMPPPVLVPSAQTIDGLAMSVPSYARRLVERFWPGGLTLIFRAQPSLMWDLGDTNGTVALRMPDDETALALLEKTGPLAVSSANRTGQPTATTVTEAGFAFGPNVEVYLDGGTREGNQPSTILDCTKADPALMRAGAVSAEQLREVLGPIELLDSTGAPLSEHPRPDAATGMGAGERAGAITDFVPQAQASDHPDASATAASEVTSGGSSVYRADTANGSEATQVMPVGSTNPVTSPGAPTSGGVGAEPPFDRDHLERVELPGRSASQPGRVDS